MGRPTDWHVLDLDQDPTPGDPTQVEQLARRLHDFADDVGAALRSIRGLAGDSAVQSWTGMSGDEYRRQFDDIPGELDKLERSYRLCGDALTAYWPKLQQAQGDADRALQQGREARADLTSAHSRLNSANDWVSRANAKSKEYQEQGGKQDVPPPDPNQVRAATRNANDAQSAQRSAQSSVDAAQGKLDAAKALAEQARGLRDDAARTAKSGIDDASDAGIPNKHWWEKVVDWIVDHWDDIVAICKVIVAVVGIIVLIIGGPLAWLVLAAALVVLADTITKYLQGKASLWDVAFAALDCIPGMKGLTTAGGLLKMAKGAPELLRSGKALENLANGVRKSGQAFRDAFTALRKGADDEVAAGKSFSGRCKGGDPIDLVSGEMVMSETDVDLPGLLRLTLRRTHISSYRTGRCFGRSWASTLDERLEADGDGVVFAADDGMLLVYSVPGPNTAALPHHGPRWPLEWDGTPGGEIRITDPALGHTRHFAPVESPADAPDGLVTLALRAVSDRNGHRVEIDRTADGTPVAVRHSGGYRIAVETRDQRVTGLRLLDTDAGPEGTELRRYGFDGDGNLVQVVNAAGHSQLLEYDAEGRIVRRTDRNGHWYRWEYDERDRCVRGEGEDGFLSCTISYDPDERTTAYTNSLGHTTTYRYNALLQLTEQTDPLGNTTHREWDEHGRLVRVTDPLGHTSRYRYDAAGNLVENTRPDGHSATASHNQLGQQVEVVEWDGATWRHTYDARGNRLSTTDPAGATTRYEYDAAGRPTAVVNALGHTHRLSTDPAGLPIAMTDPLGHTTTAERDAFGNVIAVTDPLGRVGRFGWTAEGRAAWRETPGGQRETWEWDGEGNLLSHTDANGQTSSTTYTHFHQPATRTAADGTIHEFAFDTEVNLVKVTNPQGRTWEYQYDPVGWLVAETDFQGRALTYTHDATGRLVSRTNGAGETLSFTRDDLGRPIEQNAGGDICTFAYDLAGALVRSANADSTVLREYDAAGRTVRESVNGRTTEYAYDAIGRRISRRTPSGIVSTWTYDDAGRPESLDVAGHRLDFGFDAAGQEITRRLGPDLTLSQTWDASGRLTAQTVGHAAVPGSGLDPLQHRTYAYRADGHLTEIDELTSGTRRFDVDPTGRVTAVHARGWTERYAYDTAGNLTGARSCTDSPAEPADDEREYAGNLVRRVGRTRYEYDGQGRVVRTVKRLLNGQARASSYTWSADGRLIGTETPDGTRWRYQYDPAGRRIGKQRLTADGDIAEEIHFTWDGTRLAEQATGGGRTTTWDYSPGGPRPLSQIDRDPAPADPADPADLGQAEVDERFHAIVTDLAGTPAELVSPDGRLAWSLRTTAWGAPLPGPAGSGEPADVDCPLRFPGQYADPETGWNYNYFRHYDPSAGRYVAPDPLGLGPDPNDYAYVVNPFQFCDPLGLMPYQDPATGRFARDPSGPAARVHTRDTEYPRSYRQATHDAMAARWTDEGRAQGGTPVHPPGHPDAGMRIPRDELTWRDPMGRQIPSGQLTYEHSHAVVDHWNSVGYDSNRATRMDFYNDHTHMVPMSRSENSRGGALMDATYRQDTGPNYSCT